MEIIGTQCKTSWTEECPRTKASGRLQKALETLSNLVNQGSVSRTWFSNCISQDPAGKQNPMQIVRDFNEGITYRGVGQT